MEHHSVLQGAHQDGLRAVVFLQPCWVRRSTLVASPHGQRPGGGVRGRLFGVGVVLPQPRHSSDGEPSGPVAVPGPVPFAAASPFKNR